MGDSPLNSRRGLTYSYGRDCWRGLRYSSGDFKFPSRRLTLNNSGLHIHELGHVKIYAREIIIDGELKATENNRDGHSGNARGN